MSTITLYHGTHSNFSKFSLEHSAEGAVFLTSDKSHAKKFGRVVTVSVQYDKLLTIDGGTLPDEHELEDIERLIHKARSSGCDLIKIKDFNDYGAISDTYLALDEDKLTIRG